jgi:hypothetical protein
MKRIAVMAAVLLGSAAASQLLAQGTINWGNVFGTSIRAPIYDVDPNARNVVKTGNSAAGVPQGTQTYGGTLLAGTGFTVGIFVGSSAAEAMQSMSALGMGPLSAQGLTLARTATDPTRPAGTVGVNVQLRAWNNQGGQVTSWAGVMATGAAGGSSDVFTVGPLGGTTVDGMLFLTPQTIGIRSFQLTIVPEPSLIALGALALGGLLLRRRK